MASNVIKNVLYVAAVISVLLVIYLEATGIIHIILDVLIAGIVMIVILGLCCLWDKSSGPK